MKLTVKDALEMLQAIAQLDGYQNGGTQSTPYKYSGDTRLKIAIARRKLRAIQEDFLTAREQYNNDPEHDKEALAAVIEVDIEPLPSEKFNLDDNPIPPMVLDLLGDFIVMEDLKWLT